MEQVLQVEGVWIGREEEPEQGTGEGADRDCVYTSILVERSADLLGLDPGGRLRVACVAALDRGGLTARVELLEFAQDVARGRAVPLGEPAAPFLQQSMDEETDYLRAELTDLSGFYCDVTNFVVLLCSPDLEVDEELLQAAPDRDPKYEAAHWRDVPITDPLLSCTPWGQPCWSCGKEQEDHRYGQLHPGSDTCVVVASIGAEPSPQLRHYAELMGGAVVVVRDEADTAMLAAVCRERLTAVEAAIGRRLAEHEERSARNAELLALWQERGELEAITTPVAPPQGTHTLDTPDRAAEQLELEASMAASLAMLECRPPVPEDFVDVAIYLERSAAAIAADPAGTLRMHAADALDRRGLGIGQTMYSYGHGLIADGMARVGERMSGYARALLRHGVDHTRVDLPAALRQSQRLSGPMLLAVLGSSLVELPTELSVGADWVCPGMDPGEPQGWPPEPYAGVYGETVVLGVLGAEPTAALRARCEATGGAALAIRDAADLELFAQRCAAVYRDMVETVEVDCTTGALDLGLVYGC